MLIKSNIRYGVLHCSCLKCHFSLWMVGRKWNSSQVAFCICVILLLGDCWGAWCGLAGWVCADGLKRRYVLEASFNSILQLYSSILWVLIRSRGMAFWYADLCCHGLRSWLSEELSCGSQIPFVSLLFACDFRTGWAICLKIRAWAKGCTELYEFVNCCQVLICKQPELWPTTVPHCQSSSSFQTSDPRCEDRVTCVNWSNGISISVRPCECFVVNWYL